MLCVACVQVASHRYNLYNMFIFIPVAFCRTLANKSLGLDEEDEEEDGDDGQGQAAPETTGER